MRKFIGKNRIHYEVTDSTNIRAKENTNQPDGTVFSADFQEKGRGRLSREWESEKGEGIYMSILLKPDLPPEEISKITPVAGLAVAMVLEKIADEVGIKWPNDIIIGKKKVCGILTELLKENSCVVGIGINVNNKVFSKELEDKATSVFMETGKLYDREEMIKSVLEKFEGLYVKFLKKGFAAVLSEYKKRCITLGRDVEITTPVEKYIAKAIDIDKDGAIIIERNGAREKIKSGEVSVRGLLGYV